MAGLFDTFTVAKRGLAVQQGNINTCSHNIANVQTPGYSRQRNVVETTRPFGGASRFDTFTAGQIGTGAQITEIIRIRDTFLDYQVRSANSQCGNLSVRSDYLYQAEDILNEGERTGIQAAITDFFSAFQSLSGSTDKPESRMNAMQKALTLTNKINEKYKELEDLKTSIQEEMKNYVLDINTTLDRINELNKQISGIAGIGMNANDLMDERDYLIDQLSEKFGVKVESQAKDTIDLKASEKSGMQNLINSDPNDKNYARFSFVDSVKRVDGGLEVTYFVLGDKNNPKTFKIEASGEALKTLEKNLLEDRILIGDKDGIVGKQVTDADGVTSTEPYTTVAESDFSNLFNNLEKGEIAGNQSVQDNIQNYMNQLDVFTASFAYAVNAIQTGDNGDGTGVGILDGNGNKVPAECLFVVASNSETYTDNGISAKNITVNKKILEDLALLNCGQYHVDDYSGTKANERTLAIAALKNLKIDLSGFKDLTSMGTRAEFFADASDKVGIKLDDDCLNLENCKSGVGTTLDQYYKSFVILVGSESAAANDSLSTAESQVLKFSNKRLEESGVSLDEEMADLIQFQHSYQANAKMINTVDELLDVVVNGLKR